MNPNNSGDIALLAFLDQLKNDLRAARDDQNALRLALRRTCDHFNAGDGCIAVATPSGSRAELISAIPRNGEWDLECIADFIQKRRPRIPPEIIMAPLFRRGRLWGALALRGQRPYEIPSSYRALRQVAKLVSESIELIDWQRNIEVRSQIDRKMLEQLRPKDLFYQILHGLRSLTHYDHSSALLIYNQRDNTLELVAEQIAWFKKKSQRIGLKLQLTGEVLDLVKRNVVYGFDRRNNEWSSWSGQDSNRLAELLDYNEAVEAPTLDRRERCMLCAPLSTRDGVLGVLKVAACNPGSFNDYEADLVQRFTPLAAVAIQNSQRAFTLEAKMLEAEKKHAVANLLRGVSHDVNNALGCVLPLVQQIQVDIQDRSLQEDTLAQDLEQIEQSIQTCRRIFGGMLALARDSNQGIAQANLRRALDTTLAVLRDGLERQRIRLDVQVGDVVPHIQTGQGDLEQLLLNLTANARDAMPNGGVLSVRTEIVDRKITILIQDSGCGIPSDVMSRIQEPFFTTKANGNGLGLSICRSIVWNAGGHMEMTSRPGAGTEVRVLLPVVRDRLAAATL
jgi:signal transduction histidine kinase